MRLDSINNPHKINHILSLQSQIIKPDISITSSCGMILLFLLKSATVPCRQQKHCSCGQLVLPMRDLKVWLVGEKLNTSWQCALQSQEANLALMDPGLHAEQSDQQVKGVNSALPS